MIIFALVMRNYTHDNPDSLCAADRWRNQPYLRPGKARCLNEIIDGYRDLTGNLNIAKFDNVSLSPLYQRVDIAPAENLIIDDGDYAAEVGDKLDSHISFKGISLYGGYLRREWGHFLLSSTARLWPLFNAAVSFQDIDRIVFFSQDGRDMELKSNFRQLFELAGILDKVTVITGPANFEHLYAPELSFEFGISYSAEYLSLFNSARQRALATTSAHPRDDRPLLLSRAHLTACSDRQVNIPHIDRIFALNGFKIAYPEEMQLADLIAIMDSSETILSYSGSTAHNLIFAAPDKTFAVLERSAATNYPQAGIFLAMKARNAWLVDCTYHPLITSSTDPLAIYGLTPQFVNFCRDFGLKIPQGYERHFRPAAEFRRYLRGHRRAYGRKCGFNRWESAQYPAIIEAYFDSLPRYEKWMSCSSPLTLTDWLSPRILFRALKRLF